LYSSFSQLKPVGDSRRNGSQHRQTTGEDVRKSATRLLYTGIAASLLLSAPIAAAPAGGTADAAALPGGSWESISKLPDWGGVWEPDWSFLFNAKPAEPQLAPAAAAKHAAFMAAQKKGENVQHQSANCAPPGLPVSMRQPYPIEFLFTPGKVTVAIEAYSQMRRIFTDGRKLPDDPDDRFQGNSVGHWEGDTLVVDSVGFDPQVHYVDGVDHGGQMRIQERIGLVNPDRMRIVTTITDPGVLTAPYVMTAEYKRHRDWDIQEYICQQNNRDAADAQGRPSLDLSFGEEKQP